MSVESPILRHPRQSTKPKRVIRFSRFERNIGDKFELEWSAVLLLHDCQGIDYPSPFQIPYSADQVTDLVDRLARTRWADAVADDWTKGNRAQRRQTGCGFLA